MGSSLWGGNFGLSLENKLWIKLKLVGACKEPSWIALPLKKGRF